MRATEAWRIVDKEPQALADFPLVFHGRNSDDAFRSVSPASALSGKRCPPIQVGKGSEPTCLDGLASAQWESAVSFR